MIKVGGSSTGFKIKAEVRKNKIAPPFRDVSLDYYFSLGYDKARSLLDGLVSIGLAKKTGGWYDIDGEKLNSSTLRSNPHLISLLEEKFYEAIKKSPREITLVEEGDEDILSSSDPEEESEFAFPGPAEVEG
jgi:recombination protein RecA